ncbi:DUF2169 family type VI secretion system accessory protein [Nannocystis punicea]|uniref:DUF2169 domain-containing protein n=1 Tax=Nannocystis punicea TaxID=2995304 RepID=A0ABY7GVU6_9BACT|nr:DUF2169 domain-containing protein [Nannocystis poenicansa]WAS91093.1 DUF2169 domain-containing protein [Nannocystis poenicansa]
MSVLENLTDFAAICIPSMSRQDELLTLLVVSGVFTLPSPEATAPELQLASEQHEARLADEYDGEAAAMVLLHEGQSTCSRPGTDITMHGRAHAPVGERVTRSVVELRVGPCHRRALVFGDRVWSRTAAGVRPSSPAAFESLPLDYRRCFGGSPERPSPSVAMAAEYNPAGCGLHDSDRDAVDRPLPNFEDPAALLMRPADRPRPAGFGPIARHWRPRRNYAGTYDQDWVEKRAPLWPKDVDERFFSAAPPGLLATPHLVGGEPIRIVGMSPHGDYVCFLPRVQLRARFALADRSIYRCMVLDAVHFDMDTETVRITWRASIVADPLAVRAVVVRELDPGDVAR